MVACASSSGSGAPDADPGPPDAIPCIPEPDGEACNGEDDDCDGSTDEGYPGVGEQCEVGVGICRTEGTTVCTADGASTECAAVAGTAGVELCATSMDEDCDGATDEGFPDLGGVCDNPADTDLCPGMLACTGGAQACDDDAASTVDVCGGGDQDCNPATPDGYDHTGWNTACDNPADSDLCTGLYTCSGASLVCDDDDASTLDTCGGGDQDCNPATPDGYAQSGYNTACDSTVDTDACATGFFNSCSGTTLVCSDDGTSIVETCNNADDDCDVAVDELWNKQTDPTHCGSCTTNCTNANGGVGCSGGTCTPSCNAHYGDMDGNPVNGCECDGRAEEDNGLNRPIWTDLGNNYTDCDHSVSRSANIVPLSDDDFFMAYQGDAALCVWEPKVRVTNIPAGTDYDLELYRWDGCTTGCSSANWIYQSASTAGSNTSEYIDMSGQPSGNWFGFRVIRWSGDPTPSCSNYTLTFCDGSC